MSRRTLQPPLAAAAVATNRMAPGGRMWSESEIRPLWRPVGEAGEAAAYPTPWYRQNYIELSNWFNGDGKPSYWDLRWDPTSVDPPEGAPWTPDLTEDAIVEVRLTLATIDTSIDWFEIDPTYSYSGSTHTNISFDPHYPNWWDYVGGVPTKARTSSPNVVISDPAVGVEVTFEFNANNIWDVDPEYPFVWLRFLLPPTYEPADAWMRIVSP